jgi:hypothetical protein
MYMGTTKLADPTAAPTTLLPTIMPHTVLEEACTNAPTMNSISAMRMMLRRPSASARTPVSGEATRAKKDVDEVMRDLSRVVRGRRDSEEPIETKVEDITPVLQGMVSHHMTLKGRMYRGGGRRAASRDLGYVLISEQQSTDSCAYREPPYK